MCGKRFLKNQSNSLSILQKNLCLSCLEQKGFLRQYSIINQIKSTMPTLILDDGPSQTNNALLGSFNESLNQAKCSFTYMFRVVGHFMDIGSFRQSNTSLQSSWSAFLIITLFMFSLRY
ncbi:MAG: hypothetical protein CM15mP98_06440 [Paracoccaceae bacterium]|nr:MAG: hypothetical protein CM15mP98_06440 [Paracoccaceae bacterium]